MLKKMWSYPVLGSELYLTILHRECYHTLRYYVCGRKKNLNRTLEIRLTFSNIDSRTSRRIYRLALLLCAPETLSSQVVTVPEAVERYTNPIAIGYTNFRIL